MNTVAFLATFVLALIAGIFFLDSTHLETATALMAFAIAAVGAGLLLPGSWPRWSPSA